MGIPEDGSKQDDSQLARVLSRDVRPGPGDECVRRACIILQGLHAVVFILSSDWITKLNRWQPRMLFVLIFVQLIHVGISSPEVVNGTCKGDGILKCSGIEVDLFTSVEWKKMDNSHILRRSNNRTTFYNHKLNRTFNLNGDHSLYLPDLRPEDSGTYQCLIGAVVGKRNRKVEILLRVPDCEPEPKPKPEPEEQELQLFWAGLGFLFLWILKCLMPLIVAKTLSGDVKVR